MADDQPLDEYNQALDTMVPDDIDGPEEIEDTGEAVQETAKALGITEAPAQKTQLLLEQHPEIWPDYELTVMDRIVVREAYPPTGAVDAKHATYPFLTLYERTKVLSQRGAELARGAPPFIEIPESMTDVYEIARAELEAKRLPYILKRPLPDGEYEYWRLADLMLM